MDVVGDSETVYAVFDVLKAYKTFSKEADANWEIGLSVDSYDWLARNNSVLIGDSLGLACFFLLVGFGIHAPFDETDRVAVTGALSINEGDLRVRPVAHLAEKAEIAYKWGCQAMLFPDKSEGETALADYNMDFWRVLPNFQFEHVSRL